MRIRQMQQTKKVTLEITLDIILVWPWIPSLKITS